MSELFLTESDCYRSTVGFIDSCSSTHLISCPELLTNIRKRAKNMKVHGINSNGSPLVVTLEGDLGVFGTVPYHPEARVNILSQTKLADTGYTVDYMNINDPVDPDTYFIETPDESRKFALRRHRANNAFYACDFSLFSSSCASRDDSSIGSAREKDHEATPSISPKPPYVI